MFSGHTPPCIVRNVTKNLGSGACALALDPVSEWRKGTAKKAPPVPNKK